MYMFFKRTVRRVVFWFIIFFLLGPLCLSAYGKNMTVGVAHGELQKGLPFMVWYPSQTRLKEESIHIGDQVMPGLLNAPWLKGRYGLVLISPGSGGTFLSYWRTAHFLASHGYIVASLSHRHDNAFDYSGSSSIAVFNSRPQEMSILLDHFLKTSLRQYVDTSHISVIGFSAGAYTALTMAGAVPSTGLLQKYCRVYPKPNVMCFQPHGLARIMDFFSSKQRQKLLPHPDRRIRTIVAVTPPGEALFSKGAFHKIRIPVLLIEGGLDHILVYPNNALYIKDVMGNSSQYIKLEQAGHLSFLSFMPPSLPPLLTSEKNIASKSVRVQFAHDIFNFLVTAQVPYTKVR